MIQFNGTNTGNTALAQSSCILAPKASTYLDNALKCIQTDYDSSSKAEVLARIAEGMKLLNHTKASEVFQLAFTCSLKACSKNSGNKDKDCGVRAAMIHLMFMENSLDEAKQAITSLDNSYDGFKIITSYLESYGKKGCPLTECCIEKFKQMKNMNNYQIADFAKACRHFDFDYFLEILETIQDLEVSAEKVIWGAKFNKIQFSRETIDSYLVRIDNEIKKKSDNEKLQLIKMRLSLLNGMTSNEIENWISFVNELSNPQYSDIIDLFECLKKENFSRALEMSSRCSRQDEVLRSILTSITLEQLEEAKPYMSQIEDKFKKIDLWLSIASNCVNDHPETTKELLPYLLNMVKNCPDQEELFWKPGMGKRSDAVIWHIDKKIMRMLSIINLYVDLGAIEETEKLKNHEILQWWECKKENSLRYTLMVAKYYLKMENPEQAEKFYREALLMIKDIDAYKLDPDYVRKKIAKGMFPLNPDAAFEIVMQMREPHDRHNILLEFVQSTIKSNREFAEKCLQKIIESSSKYENESKAKAYLQLIWV